MKKFAAIFSLILSSFSTWAFAAHPCIDDNSSCQLNQYEIDQVYEKLYNAFDQAPVSVKIRERGGVRIEKEDYLLSTEFQEGSFEEVPADEDNDIWRLNDNHTRLEWREAHLVEHHGVIVTRRVTDYSKLLKTNKLKGAIIGSALGISLGIAAGILLSLTPLGVAALSAGLAVFGGIFGSSAGARAANNKPEESSRVYYYDREV